MKLELILTDFYSDNAVPIKPFYDDTSDEELRTCIPFLIALRSMQDVRTLLRRRHRKLKLT